MARDSLGYLKVPKLPPPTPEFVRHWKRQLPKIWASILKECDVIVTPYGFEGTPKKKPSKPANSSASHRSKKKGKKK